MSLEPELEIAPYSGLSLAFSHFSASERAAPGRLARALSDLELMPQVGRPQNQ